MTRTNRPVQNLVVAALMLALAYVLPFFTGNIPQIGSMLLPMHLPTLLCGFLCGGPWGAVVGFLAPLMRSAILGMPLPFPPPQLWLWKWPSMAWSLECSMPAFPKTWAGSIPL